MSSPEEIEIAVKQAILEVAGDRDPFSMLNGGENPFYEPAAAAAKLDMERDGKTVSLYVANALGKLASGSRINPAAPQE